MRIARFGGGHMERPARSAAVRKALVSGHHGQLRGEMVGFWVYLKRKQKRFRIDQVWAVTEKRCAVAPGLWAGVSLRTAKPPEGHHGGAACCVRGVTCEVIDRRQ